jgi:hypothetical protein
MIRYLYHKKSLFLVVGSFLTLLEDLIEIGTVDSVSSVCLIISEFGTVTISLSITEIKLLSIKILFTA